jgi:UDPglucose 6-dehydrogenase
MPRAPGIARPIAAPLSPDVVRDVPGLQSLSIVDDPYDVASRADAVVLLTEWPEYLELELDALRDRMRGVLFVDGRNVFDPAKVEAAGFVYEGIGRSATTAEAAIEAPRAAAAGGA